jgi:hypothetical protein
MKLMGLVAMIQLAVALQPPANPERVIEYKRGLREMTPPRPPFRCA